MPINGLLQGRGLPANEVERLRRAFDLALRGLHLVDRNDPICEIVARKVIDIGADPSREAREIAELAVKQLGP